MTILGESSRRFPRNVDILTFLVETSERIERMEFIKNSRYPRLDNTLSSRYIGHFQQLPARSSRHSREYQAFSKLPERAVENMEILDERFRYSRNSQGEFLTVEYLIRWRNSYQLLLRAN